ncbi:MAG: aminoglycoside phosphotransferase family protein [Acidimicrobiia bacterium]|nr:aminoglycoside phosphotransferase family protein [Acidimicrobiia bacterium]
MAESAHVETWDPVADMVAAGLAGDPEDVVVTPLTGGVSCDTYRVDLPARTLVVKRALPRLRVADDWYAPVARNAGEVAWLRTAAEIVPGHVPRVVTHVPPSRDGESGWFAMTWFPPRTHPLWKSQLAAGRADAATGAHVGSLAVQIHAATARRPDIRERFSTATFRETFEAKRTDAYLRTTASRHPDVARQLEGLAAALDRADVALVHGDMSPKNILVGPDGPVFLDAEAACWGDPAFDVAFCLNHLLLKCVWRPEHGRLYETSYENLWNAYRTGIDWEDPADVEARTAALLPGLLLARIDGKSPVEYLEAEADRDIVREAARRMLLTPPKQVPAVLMTFLSEFPPSPR